MSFLTAPLPPYAYNLIAIAIVAFFALRGARRGFFKEFFSLLSIGLSAILAKPFGEFLAPLLPMGSVPLLFRSIVALTIGGIAAYVAVRFECFLIATFFRLYRAWRGKAKILVRLGGALIGGCFGLALVFILSWYILTMGKLRGSAMADVVSVHREALMESAIGNVAQVTSPVPPEVTEGIDILAEIAKDPAKMEKLLQSEPVQNLMRTEAVRNLAQDTEVRALAERRDVMGILNHPAVRKAMDDAKVQEALKGIDMEAMMRSLAQ